jgi:hypothetical protein
MKLLGRFKKRSPIDDHLENIITIKSPEIELSMKMRSGEHANISVKIWEDYMAEMGDNDPLRYTATVLVDHTRSKELFDDDNNCRTMAAACQWFAENTGLADEERIDLSRGGYSLLFEVLEKPEGGRQLYYHFRQIER